MAAIRWSAEGNAPSSRQTSSPIVDPPWGALMATGPRQAGSGSPGRQVTASARGTPSGSTMRRVAILSIAMAEASGPEPVYGIRIHSSRPWTQPSSP